MIFQSNQGCIREDHLHSHTDSRGKSIKESTDARAHCGQNRRSLGHTMGATPWPPAVQRLGDVFVGSLILVAPLWIGWQLHDGGGGGGELPSWVGDVGPAAHQWWDQWTTMVRGGSIASSHHHCCCSHAVLHSMCLLRCGRGVREQPYVRGGVSIELLAVVVAIDGPPR
jgi:hypothetical protein